ncbi:MAG: type II secretion system protein [Thermoanaerobaculia bacterium]
MVVMLITVMSILTAAVLPLWSGMIRRDKEEELISRGLQYAEAIRVFQRRFGRLPVQLDELLKVEPRSIRRLWDDPMTGKEDWVLLIEGAPPGTPQGGVVIDPTTGRPIPQTGPEPSPGDSPAPQPVGPIRGVHSRAMGEGFHTFLDQSAYASWEFRSDLFTRFRSGVSENGILRVSALTLGRPFRFPAPGDPGSGSLPGQQLNSTTHKTPDPSTKGGSSVQRQRD